MSSIRVDLHSHLVPGIDDGAADMEQSIALIKGLHALGYRKVITTPHVMGDYYKNTTQIITQGVEKVREELDKIGLDMEIQASAEYYLDENFQQLIADKDLLPFGDNYILFELPFVSEPPNIGQVVFDLQLAGYTPVLAHVERYPFWYKDTAKYHELLGKGVLFQLNINSLSGHYSPMTQKVAEQMIEQDMFHFIGSDTHHMGHVNMLGQMLKHPHLHKVASSPKLRNHLL